MSSPEFKKHYIPSSLEKLFSHFSGSITLEGLAQLALLEQQKKEEQRKEELLQKAQFTEIDLIAWKNVGTGFIKQPEVKEVSDPDSATA